MHLSFKNTKAPLELAPGFIRVLPFLFAFLVTSCVLAAQTAQPPINVYAGPDNDGDPATASLYDKEFWQQVQQHIQRTPVRIILRDGDYILRDPFLRLDRLGHPQNHLTIEAATPGKAVFRVAPEDQGDKINAFTIEDSQNITVRGLTFTGPEKMGYMLRFRRCRKIFVEQCDFIDMPGVYYGATGASFEGSQRITFRDCRFERIGSWDGAHMIYNAYDVRQVAVLNCRFVDCAGDFVRFRDSTDYGIVRGCHFEVTGTYRNAGHPFISIPLFNDNNPAENSADANYEYFGTNFLIHNNTFIYPDSPTKGTRSVVQFLHKGYDPPGRQHLLTGAEAETLRTADAEQRRALLKQKTGIDLANVRIFDNKYVNQEQIVSYEAGAAYGEKSKGFEGLIDLSDLVATTPVQRE